MNTKVADAVTLESAPTEAVALADEMPLSDFGSDDVQAAVAAAEKRFARRLRDLNQIGLALSAERNIDNLIELILTKARELTGADAGSLFIVKDAGTKERDDDTLEFRTAQNDTIEVNTAVRFAVSRSSLAGYAALTGEAMRFDDVYEIPEGSPYQFNASFDKANGYRTKSILVVPLHNHARQIIGVLQIINRKKHWETKLVDDATVAREVIPFDEEAVDLTSSLASQAAVALENNMLLRSIEELFESFVTASSAAIEDRDPSTSGHSQRVTALTLGMAEAAAKIEDGEFAGTVFSPIQIKELRYAGLLHDFGKIGVRENVLTKSHKLEPMRFEVVRSRLALVRHEMRADIAEHKAQLATEFSGAELQAKYAAIDADLIEKLKHIDELGEMLSHANDPAVTFLPDDDYARQQELLRELAGMTYEDEGGRRQPILTQEEIDALSIRKGSLTVDEYRQIQMHASLSYKFLEKIKWTSEFASIPNIAGCHHEKLNGKGYPRGVLGQEIPLQSRMMTVADIYDALTAKDRPYKRAMPVDMALQILDWEAREGALDPDVVKLFKDHQIYQITQEKPLADEPAPAQDKK